MVSQGSRTQWLRERFTGHLRHQVRSKVANFNDVFHEAEKQAETPSLASVGFTCDSPLPSSPSAFPAHHQELPNLLGDSAASRSPQRSRSASLPHQMDDGTNDNQEPQHMYCRDISDCSDAHLDVGFGQTNRSETQTLTNSTKAATASSSAGFTTPRTASKGSSSEPLDNDTLPPLSIFNGTWNLLPIHRTSLASFLHTLSISDGSVVDGDGVSRELRQDDDHWTFEGGRLVIRSSNRMTRIGRSGMCSDYMLDEGFSPCVSPRESAGIKSQTRTSSKKSATTRPRSARCLPHIGEQSSPGWATQELSSYSMSDGSSTPPSRSPRFGGVGGLGAPKKGAPGPLRPLATKEDETEADNELDERDAPDNVNVDDLINLAVSSGVLDPNNCFRDGDKGGDENSRPSNSSARSKEQDPDFDEELLPITRAVEDDTVLSDFDGVWKILIVGTGKKLPAKFLQRLSIRDGRVADGAGKSRNMQHNGTDWLYEGGVMKVELGFIVRTGKSGMSQIYKLDVEEEPAQAGDDEPPNNHSYQSSRSCTTLCSLPSICEIGEEDEDEDADAPQTIGSDVDIDFLCDAGSIGDEISGFDGIWDVIVEADSGMVPGFLQRLRIKGTHVIDNDGAHGRLRKVNKEWFYEGGRLFFKDSHIHRVGKSGRALIYKQLHMKT